MIKSTTLTIDEKEIGVGFPVYFIADIAANHDGDLSRAKKLIYQAAEAGADAAKFQHFQAESIVSDLGFKALGSQQSHQARWKKSVFEVYKDASVSLEWTAELKSTCKQAGITFFTSPYSMALVDHVDPYVAAYKIGSGDITWLELIEYVARKGKPYILATGACDFRDVHRAVNVGLSINDKICLMQCNTNYTASLRNFKFINLNVLKSYRSIYANIILGLSDHTPGHASVLGAVALGASMIEKHFTDDTTRDGPDHKFSMDPLAWREMVDRTRELENALGSGIKKVEDNEFETVVLQRRAIRYADNLKAAVKLELKHLEMLRPCPPDAIAPYDLREILGKSLRRNVNKGDYAKWIDLE